MPACTIVRGHLKGTAGYNVPACYQSVPYKLTMCLLVTGYFRFVVRLIFAHAQISITTETLQPPWLTKTQGDGWVSGTLGRDMAANPLQALIMHSLRMFISVHKGACANFGLTLQTMNLKFPVPKCSQMGGHLIACHKLSPFVSPSIPMLVNKVCPKIKVHVLVLVIMLSNCN